MRAERKTAKILPVWILCFSIPVCADNLVLAPTELSLLGESEANVSIGSNVLQQTTDGDGNVGIGWDALGSNTTGRHNVAVGRSSMYRSTTGRHNTAVGLQSLYGNTTGSHNVAIGRDANFSNTSGSWNTGVGVDAIPGTTTGWGNTGVGGESGYTEDLRNQNVTGSYNTWVGYQSGPYSPAQLDNATAIGYQAKNWRSNQIVIGNEDVTETVLRGDVYVERLCLGQTCLSHDDLAHLLSTLYLAESVQCEP